MTIQNVLLFSLILEFSLLLTCCKTEPLIKDNWVFSYNYIGESCSKNNLIEMRAFNPNSCFQKENSSFITFCNYEQIGYMFYESLKCLGTRTPYNCSLPSLCSSSSENSRQKFNCFTKVDQSLFQKLPIVFSIGEIGECPKIIPKMVIFRPSNKCFTSEEDEESFIYEPKEDGSLKIFTFSNMDCSGKYESVETLKQGDCLNGLQLVSIDGSYQIPKELECPRILKEKFFWEYSTNEFSIDSYLNYQIKSESNRSISWTIKTHGYKFKMSVDSINKEEIRKTKWFGPNAFLRIEVSWRKKNVPELKMIGGYSNSKKSPMIIFRGQCDVLPKLCSSTQEDLEMNYFEVFYDQYFEYSPN